jgi:2-polyprenyl-3-methyl-5-hydroxy-6-metoxy-1,4-benzoquinol methylase
MLLKKHTDLLLSDPRIAARHYFWLALAYREKGDSRSYAASCRRALSYHWTLTLLHHAVRAHTRLFLSACKHVLFRYILRPAHFGLLLRLMYFKKYIPTRVKHESVAVLDAGCGRGRFSEIVATLNPRAHITSVDIVRQKEWDTYPYKNITFKEQDLHTLNDHETYDFIMSVDVLEHILENHLIIKNFARALKPGGVLYLAVPCDATSFHIFPKKWFAKFYAWDAIEHIGKQYTLTEWQQLLEEAGLTVTTKRYTFTLWGALAWEIEYLLQEHPIGARVNVLCMPLYRLLGYLDMYLPIGKGNNLLVAEKKMS